MTRLAEFFKNLPWDCLLIRLPRILKLPLGSSESIDTYIDTVIDALDNYCAKHQIRVCLVLDEFQEICNLKGLQKIEGPFLRAGMQMAKNISFMMLGSRRTMLRDMFEDKKTVLQGADIMPLPKIPEDALVDLIERISNKEGVTIPHGDAQQIVRYCNSYPYYVQKLAWIYFDMRQGTFSFRHKITCWKKKRPFMRTLCSISRYPRNGCCGLLPRKTPKRFLPLIFPEIQTGITQWRAEQPGQTETHRSG